MLKVALLAAAVSIQAIATPPDASGPGFALQGYTVPARCTLRTDACPPTLTPQLGFRPEDDAYRPLVRISFVPTFDGDCVAAEAEMVDGQLATTPALAGHASVARGERAYLDAVLYDRDERTAFGANPDD